MVGKKAIPTSHPKKSLIARFLKQYLINFIVFFRNISCFTFFAYLSITAQMNDMYQKTLSKQISFQGIGLHSGKISKISILPNKANEGIVFKRTDKKK